MLPVSVHSLPDELVREILSDILTVPEDDFSHVGPSSPFGRKVSSSSDVLLVSKRWLRIGTPLLHECVVLRSSAQANAFYGFIRGKVGNQVKGYVRRMRLEGSFGAVVGKIFAILPGISDLYLRLPVTREENVNGLVQGLPKLNPTRVIFELSPSKLRKNSFTLMAALNHEMRQWVTLHTFRIHFTFPWYHHKETRQLDRLREALSTAPSLGQVIMSFSDTHYRFELYRAASFVEVVGRNTSLKAIHIHVDRPSSVNVVLDELLGKPCAGIVHCHLKSPQEATTESERSSPDYPECIPTLPESVWGLIIEMDLRQYLSDDPLETFLTQFRNLTRLILRAEYDADDGCPSVDTNDITGGPCFDSLVDLKIINQYTRFDVINILQSCDFPSVTTLDFILDFGTARSMDIPYDYDRLPSFPKTQVIRFTGTPRGSHLHLLHAKNSPFEKLVLKSSYRTCQNLLTGEGHITEVLNSINFSNLTRLRELQIESVEEWPWQDHELKNNAWQGHAQALIDTYGFKITDASGIPWRPRLMKCVNKIRRIS
ncbi:hypothetical protein ACEPAI_7201 [Sanghuangporus weigelae]